MLLIILANGFIGASFGHDHLHRRRSARSPSTCSTPRGSTAPATLAIVRHITLPAIRWPSRFVTIYQALSLLVSFEYIWLITDGGPFYDTTVYALYVYRRAFENGQYAYGAALSLGARRRSASSWRCCCGASSTCARCCRSRGSRCTDGDAATADRRAPRARLAARSPRGRGRGGGPRNLLLYGFPDRSARCRSSFPISGWSRSRSPAAPAASTFVLWRTLRGARAGAVRSGRSCASASRPRAGCGSRRDRARRSCTLVLLAVSDRALSAPRQLALPVEPGYRRRAQGRRRASGAQFPRSGPPSATRSLLALGADGDRGHRRHARRLLPVALRFPRPRRATSRACSSCTPSRR